MSVIREWTPEAVKKMARDIVADNAELTGKFLEVEAAARLDAIKEPSDKRFLGYRWFLKRHLLTSTVKVRDNSVTVTVGMRRQAKKGGDHHGFYIETGSAVAPANPYLRPAVFGNARDIVNLLTGR